jgi:outer membrane immunogenic protein
MLRKSCVSTLALLASSGFVFAADLPSRAPPPVYLAPPPPIFTWTGFYVGGQLGDRFGTSSSILFPTATPPAGGANLGKYFPNGVTGGAHVGYNYQICMFVAGVEADMEGSSYRGSQTAGAATLQTTSGFDSSLRGRLGIAVDHALFYTTGGVAFAPFRNQIFAGGTVDDQTNWRTGWTLGGGLEYALNNNWSLRAEYRYTDYGTYSDVLNNTTGGALSVRKHDTDNAVRAGFSYKFDTAGPIAPPIISKY